MYNFEKKEKQGILKITANSEQWNNAVERAYEANKGKFNIQGFRKGKAPRRVIEQNYGDTIFFDDAFNDIISQEYNHFLNENRHIMFPLFDRHLKRILTQLEKLLHHSLRYL